MIMRNSSAQGSLRCILVTLVVIISINILRLEGVDARSNKTLSIKVEKVGTDYGGSTPFYMVNLPIGSPNQTTMRLKLDLDSSETIVNCSNELVASSLTLHKLKCRDKRSRKSTKTLEGCEVEDSVWLNELRGNVSDPIVSVPVKKVNFKCGTGTGGNAGDGVAGFSAAESLSLPAQVSKNGRGLGKRFSYCLPSIAYFGSPDVYTKAQLISISFGAFRYVQITHFQSNQFQRTPLIIKKKKKNGPEPEHRYAISVHNMSVGGFAGDSRDTSLNLSKPLELFISTTKAYTALESSTYAALRNAFRRAVGPTPLVGPVPPFDTCYSADTFIPGSRVPNHPLAFGPVITLRLAGGATWTVSAPKYFVRPTLGLDVACFGFVDAGPDQPNVLGTFQQEGNLFEFDVPRSTLAFQRMYEPDAPENFLTDCSYLL